MILRFVTITIKAALIVLSDTKSVAGKVVTMITRPGKPPSARHEIKKRTSAAEKLDACTDEQSYLNEHYCRGWPCTDFNAELNVTPALE